MFGILIRQNQNQS